MTDLITAIDLSKYVETRLFGERPHLRGRRIPIWVIAHTAADNDHGVPELMYDFDLSEAEVLAALLYYSENQDAVEALEEADRNSACRDGFKPVATQNRDPLKGSQPRASL